MNGIDIVDIKIAVKNEQLYFYINNGRIYATNTTGETVAVGSAINKKDSQGLQSQKSH